MKLQRRWIAAATGAVLAVAGALAITSSGVSAATGDVDPSIKNDPNAANGTIAFFDSSGNQITSGPLGAPFAAYAVASSATTRTGTIKATLFVATPDHTKSNSLNWFNQQLTAASSWPLTGAPAGVTAAEGPGQPAVAIGSGDGDLGGAFAGATNDPTAGFDHIMQIRMEDSGIGKPVQPPFWATDVYIDTTANTWTQEYPAGPAPKTSTSIATISPSPASPAPHGSTVTLSSTLSAADSSHPAGSVELFDGATDKGAATFTAATGAISATDTPADGSHSYTFKFTPSDTSSYTGTTSAALSYSVNAATATSTTLTASPNGSATVGDTVTLTATVSPSAAPGSVQFFDGSTALGSPATVSGGTATLSTGALTVGSHSLTAKYTASGGGYANSTSAAVPYTINPAPATATSTSLTVTPNGTVAYGTSVNLTATVTPSAAVGKVQFYDGSTAIGSPVTVSGGTASTSTSTLAPGNHSLTATFQPTDSSQYGTSTSAASSLTVNAEMTSTSLTITPAGPVTFGTAVTLKATVAPTAATGSVQFLDGASPVGSPVPVSGGNAQLITSALAVGSHSITAMFNPTDTTRYAGSTSSAGTLVVTAAATSTAISASPASPVVTGTAVTLTATITPTAATGTVQFNDGATPVGSPVTVSGGTASTTITPAVGSHSYDAVFTPANGNYTGSTSGTTTVTVIPPPTATSTSLTVTPAGPVDYGTSVNLTATVGPANAGDTGPTAGTVTFYDGTTSIGSTALTAGGTASIDVSTLAGGSHSLTAKYTPADSTAFAGSTSAAVSLTVNAQPTTTTLTTPKSKVTVGDSVSFTATLAPSGAAGTVSFTDGSTSLGSAPVSGGKATLATTSLAAGDHSVTATFTPTDAAVYATSTSAAVTVTVEPAPVVTGVSSGGSPVSSGGQLSPGSQVTVSASGFQPDDTVTVLVDSTTLTTAQADSAGKVTVTVTLPANLSAGAHQLVLRGSLASASFGFTVAASPTPTPTGAGGSGSGGSGSGSTSGSGGSLASTGAHVAEGLGLAVLLIAAGLSLLIGGRRRRSY